MFLYGLTFQPTSKIIPGKLIAIEYLNKMVLGLVGLIARPAEVEFKVFVPLDKNQLDLFGNYGWVKLSDLNIFNCFTLPECRFVPSLTQSSLVFDKPAVHTVSLKGNDKYIIVKRDVFWYAFNVLNGTALNEEIKGVGHLLHWKVEDANTGELVLEVK